MQQSHLMEVVRRDTLFGLLKMQLYRIRCAEVRSCLISLREVSYLPIPPQYLLSILEPQLWRQIKRAETC